MKSRKLVKLQQLDFWSLEKGKKNRRCLLIEVVRKQKRKRYTHAISLSGVITNNKIEIITMFKSIVENKTLYQIQ